MRLLIRADVVSITQQAPSCLDAARFAPSLTADVSDVEGFNTTAPDVTTALDGATEAGRASTSLCYAALRQTAHPPRSFAGWKDGAIVETVRLGGTGLKVSRLCLGMMSYGDPSWRPWILDEEHARQHVRAAADAGINFYDTADVYSLGASEIVTGRLLREVFDRREDFVLATKVQQPMGAGPNDGGLSRAHILDGVDASLRRLNVDHIDLYQIHSWDADTPIEETMQALHDVVRAGKVRYLGASNLRAWQLAKAQHVAIVNGWTPFASVQNHYNLLYRDDERELLPMLADQALASVPYSPLARGILARAGTGRETTGHRYETDDSALKRYGSPDQRVLQSLASVAAGRGTAPATIALAWLLAQPVVTAPIIGVTRTEHLSDAVASLDVALSGEEIDSLGAAGGNRR